MFQVIPAKGKEANVDHPRHLDRQAKKAENNLINQDKNTEHEPSQEDKPSSDDDDCTAINRKVNATITARSKQNYRFVYTAPIIGPLQCKMLL